MVTRAQLFNFYLNTTPEVVLFETIEVSHPDFTQTYYVVRNNDNGLIATDEEDVEKEFTYYPIAIDRGEAGNSLQAEMVVTFGDLGAIIPMEVDAILNGEEEPEENPTLIYRTWQSDDLTDPRHVVFYEIENVDQNSEGSTLHCKAPEVNANRTGEIYSLDRFPTLRGFL